MNEIKKLFNKIIDVVFPPDITCIMCGNEVNNSEFCLCDDCEGSLQKCEKVCEVCGTPVRSEAHFCVVCSENKRLFDYARAPLVYKDNVIRAVHNFKYNGNKYLARPFAKIMLSSYNELKSLVGGFDLIVPIPLHKTKLKKRGFNQAELLAKEVSLLTDVPMENVAIRVKNTSTQTDLSKSERKLNLENAFDLLDKSKVKNKNVLIIDDILTTGATTESLAEILRKAKAKNICVLTFARTDIEERMN